MLEAETSRERPKSVPYLGSKIAKGLQIVKYSLLQYPHGEKFSDIFFSNFLSPGKSHSAEKCNKGGLWGFLNINSFAK